MNSMSGYGEIKIGEEQFKFKFGLNAFQMFCEHRKISLGQIGEALSETMALIELSYFAHVTETRMRGKEPYCGLVAFVEAVNEDDTMAILHQVNDIMTTSKFLGKTVEEWAGDKKK